MFGRLRQSATVFSARRFMPVQPKPVVVVVVDIKKTFDTGRAFRVRTDGQSTVCVVQRNRAAVGHLFDSQIFSLKVSRSALRQSLNRLRSTKHMAITHDLSARQVSDNRTFEGLSRYS